MKSLSWLLEYDNFVIKIYDTSQEWFFSRFSEDSYEYRVVYHDLNTVSVWKLMKIPHLERTLYNIQRNKNYEIVEVFNG